MLGWLRRNDNARDIFRFDGGGGRLQRADPVAVEASLRKELGDGWWEEVGALADAPPAVLGGLALDGWVEKQRKRRATVLPHVRTALGAADFDAATGYGLTDGDAIATVLGFRVFCATLADAATPLRECARYGIEPSTAPTYAEWVGLYLCRRRVAFDRNRDAAKSIARSVMAAWSGQKDE